MGVRFVRGPECVTQRLLTHKKIPKATSSVVQKAKSEDKKI
jgi:hypothetical protein